MKKLYFISVIVLLLMTGSNGAHAQSSQKKLNQAELLKKFFGTWKNEVSKDTINWIEFSAYGKNAMTGSSKMKVKDKIISQNKQLWGYDNRSGKIIGVELDKHSGKMIFYIIEFVSENQHEGIAIMDITHPKKVTDKFYEVFESPDKIVHSYFENNKKISTVYTRINTKK